MDLGRRRGRDCAVDGILLEALGCGCVGVCVSECFCLSHPSFLAMPAGEGDGEGPEMNDLEVRVDQLRQ